jgi:protein gp37
MLNKASGKYWDRAWSLVDGCTPVSAACDHCWLRDMDKRFHPANLEGVRTRPERLQIPQHTRKPTRFAVWSDLFHEDVDFNFIYKAIEMCLLYNQHTYLILTKRPERAAQIMPDVWLHLGRNYHGVFDLPFRNVWIGTTTENQEQADKRIPILLQIPAAKRFVSIEPMLGPVNLRKLNSYSFGSTSHELDALTGLNQEFSYDGGGGVWQGKRLDWVICGGETGPKARPMWPEWVESLAGQCQAAQVPFFFKNWGKYKGPDDWKIPAGRQLLSREWNEVPV